MRITNKISKNQLLITVCVVVVLQLVLAFQGFDVCDDGFVLTFYQQFFDNPQSVEYNFLYWFSGFFGGLWYKLYEDGGVLWFRFLGVIVNTSTFIVSYKILKPYVKKHYLLLALIMALFINDYGFLTFYHNHLTALATVITIYVLKKGLVSNATIYFVLTGFILGITTFIRLPNAAFISVLAVIPISYLIDKKSLTLAIKPMFFSAIGIIFGVLIVLLLLYFLGQLEIMRQVLLVVDDLGNTEGSSHNFSSLIYAQYYNYKQVFKALFCVFIASLAFSFLHFKTKTNRVSQILIILLFSACLIFWIKIFHIYAFYALSIFGCASLIFLKSTQKHIKYIAFMALITLFVIPFGTGGGVHNAGYMAVWLALPLFFLSIKSIHNYGFKKTNNFQLKLSVISYSLLIAFFIYKPYKIFNEAYFDQGSRLQKTSPINNKLSKYVYTTPERATIINSILEELKNHISEDDYLLVYDNMPMLHFLTKTKPYAFSPWPFIYDHNSFDKKLKIAEKTIKGKPIVVQQKFSTIINFAEPMENYMATDIENNSLHSNEITTVMNNFLERNQYEIIWSNSHFNIYKSALE